MNEKKHHSHAFTIYDPNNLDNNKASPNIPNLLWIVYVLDRPELFFAVKP